MLCGRVPAIAVLRADIVDIHALKAPCQQHQRSAEEIGEVIGCGAMGSYQHNAVHVAFDQRRDQPMLKVAVLLADGQQRHGPAACQDVLKASGEFSKVRVSDVGQNHADRVTVLGT
mgnify:CR=1 FL=1